jgi:hypothetical protein
MCQGNSPFFYIYRSLLVTACLLATRCMLVSIYLNFDRPFRYGSGRYEHVFETTTAGITIQSPQLDINTVAAGGGSRLFWRNGLFVVGPESAGAHPGPACEYILSCFSLWDPNSDPVQATEKEDHSQ